jgi:membrane associated rhomboid family serine protease
MFPIHDDNPTRSVPIVTIGLIAACTLVFLWELTTTIPHQRLIYGLGVTPALLFGQHSQPEHWQLVPAWMTIFTSMFMHGGWLHLLGNMLFLWIFGNNIEDRLGHMRYLLFYLLCGVIAVLANALPQIKSMVPMIGASGAISGVLGAYLVLFPHARVLVVIPIFFIIQTVWWPAWVVLLVWFGLQILSSILAGSQAGIAWSAHIGGFLAGMVLILVFTKRRRRRL